MRLVLLQLGLVGFGLSAVLTPVFMRIALRLGLVDRPDQRKQHRREVPYGGGLSLYLAVWITVLAGLAVAWGCHRSPPSWLPGSAAVHLAGVLSKAPQLLVILAGATIVMLLGLVDDRRGLPASLKLAVQLVVAVLLVLAGVRATLFIKFRLLTDLITVLWIVGLINAFNFLDNMDALSAGCGLVIAGLFLVVSVQTGQFFVGAMLAVLAGALAGFLPYNRPPARVFLGDAGSYLLGYMLAVLSVVFTFTEANRPLIPIALPLLIFAIPIYDSASVMLIRLKERRDPFC
jgi:UDP-GlcNAc:undecaprenyl-phosphate GlcNAc-1-phosphate transferase